VAGGFLGFSHRPEDLADEVVTAGLELDDVVDVEGLPLSSSDLATRRGDAMAWQVVLDAARTIERVPAWSG
jgi:hypothetical protein